MLFYVQRKMNTLTLKQKLLGFRLIAQEKLQAVICSIPGKKDLIIQTSLIKPLEHICGASWLKFKGIQRIFKLDDDHTIPVQSHDTIDHHVQLYMLSSDLTIFQSVVNRIRLIHENQLQSKNKFLDFDENLKYFHIICVPTCFTYFHQILEQNGLYGIVGLHRFNWDFIVLDDNVLSLEIPKVFSSVYVKSDYSFFTSIAQSLRIMQLLCGIPDYVVTYGDHSENIRIILEQLGPLTKTTTSLTTINNHNFNKWIIIDRDKDYASPLLIPNMYAGLLLEVFQYKTGTIDLQLIDSDNKITRQRLSLLMEQSEQNAYNDTVVYASTSKCHENKCDKKQKKPMKNTKKCELYLNGQQDGIFKENRYKNFTAASQEIRTQVKAISKDLQDLNTMKIQEMNNYVNRKLPKITELKSRLLCHLMASEKIIDMLAKYVRKIQTIEENILINIKNNSSINITSSSQRKSILNNIDELLTIDPQRFNSLRLFCLFHLCMGVYTDELISFIKKYCNYFGYQNVLIFHKIAQAKLLPQLNNENTESLSVKMAPTKILSTLKPALNNIATKFQQTQILSTPATATTFQLDANIYKLITSPSFSATAAITNNNNYENPSNLTQSESNNNNNSSNFNNSLKPQHIFNGIYTPLVAQLCKYCLEAKNMLELIKKIDPGDFDSGIKLNGQPLKFHINQQQLLKNHEDDNDNNNLNAGDYNVSGTSGSVADDSVDRNKSNIFVYVVGGITYAEIAACHLIGKQYKADIIVASDCILSGSDLIEQCSF